MASRIDQGVVLITGASSGIGLALAQQIAPRARVLILVARRTERLEALATQLRAKHSSLTVDVRPCDVTDHSAVDRMIATIRDSHGELDVLVNNAGMGDVSVFDRADWQKTKQMLDLNVMALAYLTHKVIGPMVARGRGGLLNVSSGFGLEFLPGLSAYIGTKFFVTGFTEALRLELAGTGVTVTQVCPGPVATEFETLANTSTDLAVPKFVEISADQCARETLRGFDRGKALIIPGALMKVVLLVAALTPRWLKRLVLFPVGKKARALLPAA